MVNWNRDEILFAADLLVRNYWVAPRRTDYSVEVLSNPLINSAWILPPNVEVPDKYRSADSVHRKIEDLRTADPKYRGRITKGGQLTWDIAERFRNLPERMHDEGTAVRTALESSSAVSAFAFADSESVIEGDLLARLSFLRERAPELRARKLSNEIQAGRPVAFEDCATSISDVDVARGQEDIEIHYLIPSQAVRFI